MAGRVLKVGYEAYEFQQDVFIALIVFGIFLMFYMRAYFFKRPAKGAVQ